MKNVPSGTVTFLFTDIEGSTQRRQEHPQAMEAAFARQEALVQRAIEANGGYAYKVVRSAFQAAFSTALQGVQAALDAQQALHSEMWPQEIGELRVRMALHTGVTEERGSDYVGPALNRVARLLSAGHGGQVLLTQATAELVRGDLPEGVTLKDLGVHRLRDLVRPENIFQLVTTRFDLPSEFGALSTLDVRPNNLPQQSTPFIGREKEVAEVEETLRRRDVWLLILTGAGGIGKTRLALEVATNMLDEFRDGVFFVPLTSVTSPDLVVPAITQTLSLREESGQPLVDTLKDYLRSKSCLLVLDNFEQVLDAAPVVADLLRTAPELKMLVTSRADLRLSIEHEYHVPPLSIPDPKHLPPADGLMQYEAAELFISRAQAVNSAFAVNNDNSAAIAEICVQLEGLPLALELAAARTRVLSPQRILDRLRGKLGNRLSLLTGGARDLPARQQTLRATIDWSYELLDSGEKQLFRRLAVFAGGFMLEDAEMVCNAEGDLALDVLYGVESLVSKSLVRADEDKSGNYRFAMLQTIQEYAGERLEESTEAEKLRQVHAQYFLKFAEDAEQEIVGANESKALQQLDASYENLLAALEWSTQKGGVTFADLALRLCGALWRYWWIRGYLSEGRRRLELALGQSSRYAEDAKEGTGEESTLRLTARAKALNGLGNLAFFQGDYDAARVSHEEALLLRRELGDTQGVAASLNNLGNAAVEQGDYPAARSYLEQAVAILRELDSKRWIAVTLGNLAAVVREQGEYDRARALFEESLSILQAQGDTTSLSNVFAGLGHIALEQGDYIAARSHLQQALDIDQAAGHKPEIAMGLHNLANVAEDEGDYETAWSLFQQSLAMKRELGDKRGIGSTLSHLAAIDFERGNYTTARAFIEESLALRQETGGKRGIAECLLYLGKLSGVEKDYAKARSFYEQALDMRVKMGDRYGIIQSLLEFAYLAVQHDQLKRAVLLFSAVEALYNSIGARLPADQRARYEQTISDLHSRVDEAVWEGTWQEGRALSMEQAIACALELS